MSSDQGKWKVWSGNATQDFLKSVNEEAATMAGEPKRPFTLVGENPMGLASFGLLNQEVEFFSPFYKSLKLPMEFLRLDRILRPPVRVETSMDADLFGSMSDDYLPRKFHYDRPFFVFLWRKDAEWPYFGVWLGDAKALRKF